MDFCRFREWAIKWREKFSGGESSLRDFSTGTLAANCLHTSSHDIFVRFTLYIFPENGYLFCA